MGTSISGYIEQSNEDDRKHSPVLHKYETFATLELMRNYSLFALLAFGDVRGEPIISPRGIPKDLSWQASSEYYVDYETNPPHEDLKVAGFFTPSWLTLNELNQVQAKYEQQWGIGSHCLELEAIIATMEILEKQEHTITRFVFWFD